MLYINKLFAAVHSRAVDDYIPDSQPISLHHCLTEPSSESQLSKIIAHCLL